MRQGTIPAGEDARRLWRTIDRYSKSDADTFAAAVWRFSETGEATRPDAVTDEDWAEVQAEVDRIKAARVAAKKGGENGTGKSKARHGNQNASKTQAETQATRAHEDEEEEEEEEENKDTENRRPRRPVDTRAPARAAPPSTSTVFGISPPSASTDFASWAWAQKDPVKVALRASGEGADKAPVYGAKWRDLKSWRGEEDGRRRFVEECIAFRSELDAGEPCENPGRALVARLNKLIEDAKAEFRADAPLPGMIDNFAAGFKETVASLSASKRVNTDA